MQDQGRRASFSFDVTATGTVSIEGQDARQARDALLDMLDGANATVVARTGGVLAMDDLRPSTDVVLLTVDGTNPVARLAEALRAFRRGGEGP